MADFFVDRKSSRPNRYKVTPDSGSPYYVTLERADEPSEVGTPLTAANLNRLVLTEDVANLYVWKKFVDEPSEEDLSSTSDSYKLEAAATLTLSSASSMGSVSTDSYDSVSYASSFTYNSGTITLVNSKSVLVNSTSAAEVLRGKYIQKGSYFYYIDSSASFTKTSSGSTNVTHTISVDKAQKITVSNALGYVVSLNKTEHPENGKQDGFWYVYHKRLGD